MITYKIQIIILYEVYLIGQHFIFYVWKKVHKEIKMSRSKRAVFCYFG